MPIITLTTDYGNKDHSVAALKGTILAELSDVTLVDISHEIAPFNIQECAYILKNAYRSFPEGSIHIVGLDAEETPENQHIVVMVDNHYFISANNGVISLITKDIRPERIAQINIPNTAESSFPALEIFVRVACHLARGGKMEVVSRPFENLKELKEFEPRISDDRKTIYGHVIYIDNYGNAVTNIQKSLFEAYRSGRKFEIIARRAKLASIYNNYSEFIDFNLPKIQRKGAGDLLALFNTSGYIELAIYKSDLKTVGGAASLLGLGYRDTITINFL